MAEKLTPNQVARMWHVSPKKVLAWIRSRQLRAINVASPGSKLPQWRIDESDLRAFEDKLAGRPAQPAERRRQAASAARDRIRRKHGVG